MKLTNIKLPAMNLSRKEKEMLGFAAGATLVAGLFAVGFGMGAATAVLTEKIRRRDTIAGENWDEDPILEYAKNF